MAPRSFSEDGAAGASSSTDVSSHIDDSGMSFGGFGVATTGTNNSAHNPFQGSGSGGWSVTGSGGMPGGTIGSYFSEGGAIDEGDPNATDPQGSALGNSLQASINAALGVVDNALSYGRKLHGLGGGDDDDGAIKGAAPQRDAARMNTVPGTPSESGQRQQPAPGPLPPTSNPFGKRADASQDSAPQEDQSGAIPMEEEEAA